MVSIKNDPGRRKATGESKSKDEKPAIEQSHPEHGRREFS